MIVSMTDELTLAVIGATGRTGIPLTRQAIGRGHTVRALVRSPGKRGALPDGVEVVAGDALDAAAVAALVDGADVALDVSGPVRGGPDDYRRRSTEVLLTALRAAGDVRLIHLTGAGVRHPDDRPGLADRAVRGLMRVVAGPLLADSTAAVEAIRAADVDALVVRGPRLTEGDPAGTYRLAPAVGEGSGIQIRRADLATALLDLAERTEWPAGSPVASA